MAPSPARFMTIFMGRGCHSGLDPGSLELFSPDSRFRGNDKYAKWRLMLKKKHIPNALTYARMACVPLVVAVWYLPAPYGLWLPFALVLFASLTDFLDGYLARKWNVESDIGRLLDPNADKLLIAVALILLASAALAHPAAVCLILVRELFVSGLREFMAEKQIVIHVTFLAKCKTATQMLSVIVLLLAYALGHETIAFVGCMLLWIATALTLLTGYDYWRGVWKYLRAH